MNANTLVTKGNNYYICIGNIDYFAQVVANIKKFI